jgi:hypothetical protein
MGDFALLHGRATKGRVYTSVACMCMHACTLGRLCPLRSRLGFNSHLSTRADASITASSKSQTRGS